VKSINLLNPDSDNRMRIRCIKIEEYIFMEMTGRVLGLRNPKICLIPVQTIAAGYSNSADVEMFSMPFNNPKRVKV